MLILCLEDENRTDGCQNVAVLLMLYPCGNHRTSITNTLGKPLIIDNVNNNLQFIFFRYSLNINYVYTKQKI